MKNLVGDWIDKKVRVTLRGGIVPIILDGKLMKADESGILLEFANTPTFVPITSILHISLA